MKILKRLFETPNEWIKAIGSDNKKQLEEIHHLEKKIQELQISEKKNEDKKGPMMLTNRMALKFWLFGLLVVFLGYVLFQTLDILYLILTAYIVAISMEAIIDQLEKKSFPRGLSIVITYFTLIVVLLSGFVFLVPFVLTQASEIINMLIIKVNALQQILQNDGLIPVLKNVLPGYIQKEVFHNFTDPMMVYQLQEKLQTHLSGILALWSDYANIIGSMAVNFVTGFVSFLVQSGIVITLAVLFSIEKIQVMKFIASLGGQKRYKYMYMKLEKIYKKLGIWLKSRIILSLYIGVAMYVFLWILAIFGLDIPNKGSLAMILGLLDIIPYIGPALGGLPAVLIAFTTFGIWGALIMCGLVFLINFIESNVLIPILMNKTLGINTIVIFISMIVGGLIMGFVGILLSVPLAVIVTLLLEKELEE